MIFRQYIFILKISNTKPACIKQCTIIRQKINKGPQSNESSTLDTDIKLVGDWESSQCLGSPLCLLSRVVFLLCRQNLEVWKAYENCEVDGFVESANEWKQDK